MPDRLRLLVGSAALVAATACADHRLTAPAPPSNITGPDAIAAADGLQRIADSVAAMQGEDAALPFRDASDVVRASRVVSTIQISVDGTSSDWSAIATERQIIVVCPVLAPGQKAPGIPCGSSPVVTRTLVAWQAGDPRHLLVLTTPDADAGDIGMLTTGTMATDVPGFLQYLEGRTKLWFGTAGKYASTVTPGDACKPQSSSDAATHPLPFVTCKLADFTWTLTVVTVSVPAAGTVRKNDATGTHTIALAKSSVSGAIVGVTVSPVPVNPVKPIPVPLIGALDADAGSDVGMPVGFAFTVKNISDRPFTINFGTSQQFDVVVTDRSGQTVWRWSDGQKFTTDPTTRDIPAHSSVTFTATWTPNVHGELMAAAMLTSTNVKLAVRAPFKAP